MNIKVKINDDCPIHFSVVVNGITWNETESLQFGKTVTLNLDMDYKSDDDFYSCLNITFDPKSYNNSEMNTIYSESEYKEIISAIIDAYADKPSCSMCV